MEAATLRPLVSCCRELKGLEVLRLKKSNVKGIEVAKVWGVRGLKGPEVEIQKACYWIAAGGCVVAHYYQCSTVPLQSGF